MKLKIWTTLFSLTLAQFAWGQTSGNSKLVNTEGTAPEASATSYTVLGATSEQEALVRAQIRIMQPDVYPLRVLFVPHWKYVDTARTFRLHVPAGYTSAMFTHLPSRSVFIDSDRYVSDDSLGYWVAHELGHLAANSASENAADKAAREYRKRLKDARKQPAEVHFELYNDNLIIVKGNIGLIENVNILLDTGTSPTAISKELAGRLNLRGSMEPLLSSNGKIDVQTVVVPRIDIGALHMASARVVVQDLSFMQRALGVPLGAIAGLDVLSSGSFMIDYRTRRIVFAPANTPKNAVRFDTQKPFLTVKVRIAGHVLRLLVDSGTPRLLLFRKRLEASLAKLEPLPNETNTVIFTATGTMYAAWFRASDVSLGTQSIGSQIMLVADGDPDPRYEFDGLLGLAKTGFQRVWLDFENGLLRWD